MTKGSKRQRKKKAKQKPRTITVTKTEVFRDSKGKLGERVVSRKKQKVKPIFRKTKGGNLRLTKHGKNVKKQSKNVF